MTTIYESFYFIILQTLVIECQKILQYGSNDCIIYFTFSDKRLTFEGSMGYTHTLTSYLQSYVCIVQHCFIYLIFLSFFLGMKTNGCQTNAPTNAQNIQLTPCVVSIQVTDLVQSINKLHIKVTFRPKIYRKFIN